jgi:hypothetical protein
MRTTMDKNGWVSGEEEIAYLDILGEDRLWKPHEGVYSNLLV